MRNASRAALIAAALFFLYLYGLGDTGLIDPDEPRYSSIGREMARSGDWITPRLWGEAWFEKPALEYWGIALAYKLGFNDDWAPRVFNATLGVAFLVFFWWILARIYNRETAWTAAAILGTSVGWVAESHIAVMDLPLAATFSTAMLVALAGWIPLAGIFLGFAVLAKGLLPLALAAPALWFFRRQWRDLLAAALGCIVVAGPWYAAMMVRHGRAFFDEFIIRHHFGRLTDSALQHEQPVWFFVPVLLAALFPWTPLAAMLRWRKDPKHIFLWAWLLFGLLFLSISRNKLPGYVLPLLPPLAILCALAASESKRLGAWCAACGLLLGLTPLIADALPDALANGLSRIGATVRVEPIVLIAVGAAGAGMWRKVPAVAATAALCLSLMWIRVAPALDGRVSARPLWKAIESRRSEVCVETMHRAWRYGLNFYSQQPLPNCEKEPRPIRIRQQGSQRPEILLESQKAFPGPAASPGRDPF